MIPETLKDLWMWCVSCYTMLKKAYLFCYSAEMYNLSLGMRKLQTNPNWEILY